MLLGYDKYGVDPTFPFGFGLSYTTFEYANISVETVRPKSALPAPRPDSVPAPQFGDVIPDPSTALFPHGFKRLSKFIYPYIEKVSDIKQGKYPYPQGYDVKQPPSQAGGGEGGNPDLWNVYAKASINITNTGNVAGKEVVQLYVSFFDVAGAAAKVDFPRRVLRGFEKIHLDKGATETVHFNLTRRDLSYWDVVQQNWVMPDEGAITIGIGASSRDIRLTAWY